MAPVDGEGDPWNETVYIGCSHHIDEDGEHCSFGSIWYAESDERNRRVPVPRELASKEGGATAAILYAIQSAPREVALDLKIHSKTLIKNLTTDLIKNKDTGWARTENSELIRTIAVVLRGRGSACTLQRVDGAENRAMIEVSNLANTEEPADELEETVELSVEIPQAYKVSALKLVTGTQKSFYKAIKAKRKKPERQKTFIMLARTRAEAEELAGRTLTDCEIWKSLLHLDITQTTRDFLWRCMHQAYKIGEY
ncbi:hypothetical protein DFH08DRAFT_805243 [Mycena albidolilacea]|uniref:Uncharacterized protein n=1 Tax=Mycena albidolilacea TaxID=1033008 RepID=A0AAD7EUF8_9AGAR|nr:hypothetical protein DFH08DRAFT_805243 [Mycena albidolilacea]